MKKNLYSVNTFSIPIMKLFDTLRKKMVSAICDYDMIADGDQIMVAMSGGEDSTALLFLLEEARKRAPIRFKLFPVMLNQKIPGFYPEPFKDFLKGYGFHLTILEQDVYSIFSQKTQKGKSNCRICSRLRRGILYSHAIKKGYHKIATGHNRDDLNETILMNMFYSGELSGMPPKLFADDEKNILIRPLCYIPKPQISNMVQQKGYMILPGDELCGYKQQDAARDRVKAILKSLDADNPKVSANVLASQKNVRPSQLLDRRLWEQQ